MAHNNKRLIYSIYAHLLISLANKANIIDEKRSQCIKCVAPAHVQLQIVYCHSNEKLQQNVVCTVNSMDVRQFELLSDAHTHTQRHDIAAYCSRLDLSDQQDFLSMKRSADFRLLFS